ncbi:MAG: heme-binding protein [Planctomycetota bacterium]|jgi:hypothetical protein
MSYDELVATAQQQLEAEPGDSDTAVILTEALAAADAVAEPERPDILRGALSRAREARSFEPLSESPLPDGWPEPSLPGLIRIKRYPVSRAAWVEQRDGQNGQFRILFRHIQRQQIAMTAPVIMGYDRATADDPEAMTGSESMAFLYRSEDQNEAGQFGPVTVRDDPPLTMVSVGVQGGYTTDNFRRAAAQLTDWLAERPQWQVAGPPRVLAYNSPFVIGPLKYAEVQIPVDPAE